MNFFDRTDNVWAWLWDNDGLWEILRGWLRLLVILTIPLLFTLFAMQVYENIKILDLARRMQENSVWLARLPVQLVACLTPFSSWNLVQYWLPLLAVFLLILFSSARYVQSFYGLPDDFENFQSALQYVFASVFGLFYPTIIIEGDDLTEPEMMFNPLWRIGGPGFVIIRPGNAVLFRMAGQSDTVSLERAYFLKPFETIGSIATLTDQCGKRDEIWAVTRDGIQLLLKDITYSYRLLQEETPSQQRTISNPYPFSINAMRDYTYNMTAGDSWESAAGRFITGEIKNFISEKDIDYLTAPRINNQNPRVDFRNQLFTNGITRRLREIGTELLWVDVGHVDILDVNEDVQQNVDGQRFAYWASSQIGLVNAIHAKGDADRIAYQERGRVEAQAELLKNITDSMQGFEKTGDPAENLRRILLVRTAQILEGLGEAGRLKKDEL